MRLCGHPRRVEAPFHPGTKVRGGQARVGAAHCWAAGGAAHCWAAGGAGFGYGGVRLGFVVPIYPLGLLEDFRTWPVTRITEPSQV